MNIQAEFDFPAAGGSCSAPSGVCALPVQTGGGSFRVCKKCGMDKNTSDFYKNKNRLDGLCIWCKQCSIKSANKWTANNRLRKMAYNKNYWESTGRANYKANIGASRESCRKYRTLNKEKIKESQQKWKICHPDKRAEHGKKYRSKNRHKLNLYFRNWLHKSPSSRIVQNMRGRLWCVLRGASKASKTKDIVGCSIENLWIHLESRFSDGMTRKNYGLWHVDHIRPCSSFDLSDPEQQKQCFHFSNLQPLWAKDNLKKWKKYSAIS
jgi:hypothetical protein